MRKGIQVAKNIKNLKMPDFNLKQKYNVYNTSIEDKFNLNSFMKNMNLEPIFKRPAPILNKPVITCADIDEFNTNLLKSKNMKLNVCAPNEDTQRMGLVGTKVGMMSLFDKFGATIPVTVIKIENNQVISINKTKNDKYNVEVGGGYNPNLPRNEKVKFYQNNIQPKRHVYTFKVTKDALLPVGYILTIRHFMVGQKVEVQGTSRGKGTLGVMQRWGFKGGVATHGNSLAHRTCGSIGGREFPGRVWPGKKMAGKTGNETAIVKASLIYKTDYENGLIYIKGGAPGVIDGKIILRDVFFQKHIYDKYLYSPTFVPEPGKVYENVTQYLEAIDAFEKYPHDNDERMGISGEEEEGEDEFEKGDIEGMISRLQASDAAEAAEKAEDKAMGIS